MPRIFDYLSEKYQTADNQEINQRLVELSSLFEISQILNSSLELNEVLNNILLIPMGRLMISKGLVLLRKQNTFVPGLNKGINTKENHIKFNPDELPSDIFVLSGDQNKTAVSETLLQFLQKYQLSITIPLKSQNQLVGLVLYGPKLNKEPFSEDEINFLDSLAGLSATSVENALKVEEIRSINQQLDERIQQLKTLFDIGEGLSATLENDKIIKLLTYAIMGQMLVYHYAIALFKDGCLQRVESKGFLQDSVESLAEDLVKSDEFDNAQRVSQLRNENLKNRLSKMGAQVFIPMQHQNKTLGVILLGNKFNKQEFTSVDIEFLTTLVSQAVISLENARLFKESLEKERIEQELQVAKTIQTKLLPREIAQIKGYDVWGVNISSKEVGGDYFDIIPLSKNRYVIAIGDVSGKSVPASLLMANLQAGLRIIINTDLPLNQVVGKLNKLIYENTDLDKYITFFIGILDNEKHEFTFVNAGHNPPILHKKSGELSLLNKGGIILGMMPDYPFETGVVEFHPSDLLLCYTDGVNEAMNLNEEEFGEKRIEDLIKSYSNEDSKLLANRLIDEIQSFTAGAPQYDDITLVIAKRI